MDATARRLLACVAEETAVQADSTLMSGGLGLNKSRKKTVLCTAFVNAVQAFCDEGPASAPQRRSFADFFYRALKAPPNSPNYIPGGAAMAADLAREVPILYASTGHFLATGLTSAASLPGGAVGATVQSILALAAPIVTGGAATTPIFGGGITAAASQSVNAINAAAGSAGMSVRYADGIFRSTGQVLELKGPGDSFHDTQGRDVQKKVSDKPSIVASCESCGVKPSCSNGCVKGATYSR